MPAERRPAYLDKACAGDTWLRKEVDALLASDEGADTHIGGVVQGMAAAIEEELPKADIGTRIGPYILVREIGRGGMGVVYQAARTDGEFVHAVAVKLVRHGMGTAHILQRFRAERQILAALQHPNIAALLDGGTTADGRPYFVMEYIEGQPLLAYCRNKELGQPARLELFQAVCAAVQHAHERRVIHRDIKPGNVLVTADGIPKLLDFGVAKILNPGLLPDGEPITRSGFRILTPDYASPEQLRGVAVTAASDIYCLGKLLLELLAGKRDEAALASLPPDLARIVSRATERNPADRYVSAQEFSNDIRKVLREEPLMAAPQPRWPWFAAVAALIVVVGLAAFAGVRSRGRAAAEPSDPVVRSMYIRAHDLLRQDPRIRDTAAAIPPNFAEAVRLLEDATQRDPRYAAAWSLLGQACEFTAEMDAVNEAQWIVKAKSAARKAIALNPAQADAYALLAGIAFFRERDLQAAERQYKRAIDLDPHNPYPIREYADLLRITGRSAQARTEMERAIVMSPNAARLRVQRALLFYDEGRCAEAVSEAHRALVEREGMGEAHWLVGLCLEREGRYEQAEAEFQRVLKDAPADGRALPAIGHLYASMGRRSDAARVLSELEALRRKGKKVQYGMAMIHTALGNVPAALYWLHQAFAEHDNSILYMGVEYRLRSLHGEPAFQEIQRSLRLIR